MYRALHRERGQQLQEILPSVTSGACQQLQEHVTERYIGSVSTLASTIYRALHRERVNNCKKSYRAFHRERVNNCKKLPSVTYGQRVNNCKKCTERYIGSVSTMKLYRALHRERVNCAKNVPTLQRERVHNCKTSYRAFHRKRVDDVQAEDLSSVTSATCQRLYNMKRATERYYAPPPPPPPPKPPPPPPPPHPKPIPKHTSIRVTGVVKNAHVRALPCKKTTRKRPRRTQ